MWFKPWRTIDGQELAPAFYTELQVLIEGVFEKRRFLSLLRDFIVFEDDGGALVRKMAGYHQFHAVEAAVGETLRGGDAPAGNAADRRDGRPLRSRQAAGRRSRRPRIGVVWHTQGSGKSLTMAFYAGRIIREPAMANPTVVVLTDRNDLDDQLFGTFARCQDLLRQPPVQAASRRTCAPSSPSRRVASCSPPSKSSSQRKGDQHPVLSKRCKIVVIADEAHPANTTSSTDMPGTARCAAQRIVHRLHRHADRSAGRQHPRRIRGIASASTTSGARSRTRRRCRSTTRAGSPS